MGGRTGGRSVPLPSPFDLLPIVSSVHFGRRPRDRGRRGSRRGEEGRWDKTRMGHLLLFFAPGGRRRDHPPSPPVRKVGEARGGYRQSPRRDPCYHSERYQTSYPIVETSLPPSDIWPGGYVRWSPPPFFFMSRGGRGPPDITTRPDVGQRKGGYGEGDSTMG